MIRIKIEGKNIADLWSLACVRFIEKQRDGSIVVGIAYSKETPWSYCMYAYTGDTIEVESEQSKTGKIIDQEQCLRARPMQ